LAAIVPKVGAGAHGPQAAHGKEEDEGETPEPTKLKGVAGPQLIT
jgi:hypothetical protein